MCILFKIYNEARITYLYRTLDLLVSFHLQNGYAKIVINYVFESSDSLQALLDLLTPLDPNIHAYWLTCERKYRQEELNIVTVLNWNGN